MNSSHLAAVISAGALLLLPACSPAAASKPATEADKLEKYCIAGLVRADGYNVATAGLTLADKPPWLTQAGVLVCPLQNRQGVNVFLFARKLCDADSAACVEPLYAYSGDRQVWP